MNWTRQFILIALIYSLVLFGVGFYSGYSSWDRFLIKSATLRLLVNAATTTTIEYSNTSSEMMGRFDTNEQEFTNIEEYKKYIAIAAVNYSMFYNKTIDYRDIIERFGMTHEWKHFYNCENGSVDLSRELNKAGYESSVECGYFYNDCDPDTDYWSCRHCWVSLNLKIEPFEGRVLTLDEFKELYGT